MANNYNYSKENENNIKKVYINPNFQGYRPQNGSMHVNPLFSQQTNPSINSRNQPKIYVNPKFVQPCPSLAQYPTNHLVNRANELTSSKSYPCLSIPSTSSRNVVCYTGSKPSVPNPCPSTPSTSSSSVSANILAKSRYSFVRQNTTSGTTAPQIPCLPKAGTKNKLNKYKYVSIENMKKFIENEKSDKPPNKVSIKSRPKNFLPKVIHNQFKFVKKSTSLTPTKIESKSPSLKRRPSKNKLKISQKVKPKIDKGQFQKNNIPCPQFRKYGKCLRSTQGHCHFLHDKKHVAICKRFLKGICYDNNCLLSHELTAEKMPTCAFYLKGMCIKNDCPYLHVKLNENAKICPDFTKGFCVKGNTCLNRHIHICPEVAIVGECHRKSCPYPHNSRKSKVLCKNKTRYRSALNIKSSQKVSNKQTEKHSVDKENGDQENKKDCDGRYYKVVDSGSPEVETIKPTRCKLGALPSFIQL